MGKTSNVLKKRDMHQLKDYDENDQNNLATKSETTKFAQLQEEKDRTVMLTDVKNACQKGGNISPMSIPDRRRN